MTTESWLGRRPESQALVLAGGGSKASFQIGALRYLYEITGINPDIFVGTSAGAIEVAMLAQHADANEQAEGVRVLEKLWRSMRAHSDMFTERAWTTLLRERGEALMEARRLTMEERRRRGEPEPDEDENAGRLTSNSQWAELDAQARTLALATRQYDVTSAPVKPLKVIQSLRAIPRLSAVGSDIAAILRGAQQTGSLYIPGGLLEQLLSKRRFDSSKIATSGHRVRIAMVGMGSGELRYMTENGTLVDRANSPIQGSKHDFSLGVLASCSIPGVFAPVEIDDEWYLDGGLRDNVPVEMAMAHLSATNTYVVVSKAAGVPHEAGFSNADMISIMLRSVEILADETERDEIAYARSAGAVVIEPEIDIHDAFTVDPGLIAMNIDYGWVRAAEEMTDQPTAVRRRTRQLFNLRLRAKVLERSLENADSRAANDVLTELTSVKLGIQRRADQLPDEVRPEGADQWWQRYESRPASEPTSTPPWMSRQE